MAPTEVDILIVGGGPAGLGAALVFSRANYSTAIFDGGSYRNAVSKHVHMLPTWDHQDPAAYRAAARKELTDRYDTNRIIQEAVTSVKKDESSGLFQLKDASGAEWTGKKLILALGVKDIFPNISGYKEAWSTGIFHCLFCHGWEDRGAESVGVLAVELLAMVPQITDSLARNAFQFTKRVNIYTNGSEEVADKIKPLLEKKNVHFDNRPIKNLQKESTGAKVTINFEDGASVTEGFLVHAPRNEIDLEFARKLDLKVTPLGGELQVNPPFNETTTPGCFAAGDISSMAKATLAAVSSGGFAAMGAVRQLQMD